MKTKPLVVHVVGARPNFMKAAPVMRALAQFDHIEQRLVHTGQHFDNRMSQVFFQQLGLPNPDNFLGIKGDDPAGFTAAAMEAIRAYLVKESPDMVIVYGDVNSTLAAAMAAFQEEVPLVHVESGLRSGDREMPEEVNRILTDHMSDLLLTPSNDADENLRREGIPADRICYVGNVMLDSLEYCIGQARVPTNLEMEDGFVLVTLHRPSNVDKAEKLYAIIEELILLSEQQTVVFPVHPRTWSTIKQSRWSESLNKSQIHLMKPVGYLEFIWLQQHAGIVVTDSGGIQEETSWLGVPCLTLRDNTERPVTISHGTNQLIGSSPKNLSQMIIKNMNSDKNFNRSQLPDFWDGRTGPRIASAILKELK